MKTLFDDGTRDEILARLDRLRPEPPRWGRMNASQMLCHTADQLRSALGELDGEVVRSPLAYPPLNWLFIYVLPWPRGKAKSPPSLLQTRPTMWDADRAALRTLIHRFAERGEQAPWPASPAFGKISGRAWGVLAYRHLDHHLRQFGA